MKLATVYATVFLVFLVMVSETNTAPAMGQEDHLLCCKLRIDCCRYPPSSVVQPNTMKKMLKIKTGNYIRE